MTLLQKLTSSKTKNTDHEIEPGTTLTLVVKYYDLKGEEATREKASAVGLTIFLLTLVIFVKINKRH